MCYLWKTMMYVVNPQAQKTITELQAHLDLLKGSAESPQTDTEDVAQLKVCKQVTRKTFRWCLILFVFVLMFVNAEKCLTYWDKKKRENKTGEDTHTPLNLKVISLESKGNKMTD